MLGYCELIINVKVKFDQEIVCEISEIAITTPALEPPKVNVDMQCCRSTDPAKHSFRMQATRYLRTIGLRKCFQ